MCSSLVDFQTVETPLNGLYRVARRMAGPFEPASWSTTDRLGGFSSRFDDPRTDLEEEHRFRMIYCATDRQGALGETIADFRPPMMRLASKLNTVSDDEPLEDSYPNTNDPADSSRGLVEAEWRAKRAMGHTVLERGLQFVDLGSARTLQQLRASFGDWAPDIAARDIDQSLVMGPSRDITQQIARYIYEQTDEIGVPLFAGIRYISRLDQGWECWAIFSDRIRHIPGRPGIAETIFPDDPDLLAVASIFRLTIETVEGHGRYYRP
jgi:hypothetical protein